MYYIKNLLGFFYVSIMKLILYLFKIKIIYVDSARIGGFYHLWWFHANMQNNFYNNFYRYIVVDTPMFNNIKANQYWYNLFDFKIYKGNFNFFLQKFFILHNRYYKNNPHIAYSLFVNTYLRKSLFHKNEILTINKFLKNIYNTNLSLIKSNDHDEKIFFKNFNFLSLKKKNYICFSFTRLKIFRLIVS